MNKNQHYRLLFLTFLLTTITIVTGQIKVDYKTLQLSYATIDRTAGILKSIGYAVVDFESKEGVNQHDLILTPTGDFANVLVNGTISEDNLDALPLIIVLPETDNITLLEMQGAVSEKGAEMGVDLGGSSLVYTTSGEPLQRLMIAYNPKDPDALKKLVSIITNQIDVPAKQIMIEALVLEIDANKTNQLGVNFSNSGSMYSTSFPPPADATGTFEPFTYIMDKTLLGDAVQSNAKLEALMSDQSAQILSRPSVLVIDGRQARIVVGQQIPIARSTATGQNVVSATEYIPIGIVLNLRPRISTDGNDITIQVETIISEAVERVGVGSVGGDVLSAPVFNSRKVQTYVQVANNTPFIIGGLIADKTSNQKNLFPWLGKIPILGNLLGFNKETVSNKEVIVVITPHIVDLNAGHFTHVIPKEIDLLNHWGGALFQNSYRLGHNDVYDLGFFQNTSFYNDIVTRSKAAVQMNPAAADNQELVSLNSGSVPGQEVLIRRMLYDIIEREGLFKYINPKRIIFFGKVPDNEGNMVVDQLNFADLYFPLLKKQKNNEGVVLEFESTTSDKFVQDYPLRPVATITTSTSTSRNFKNTLRQLNLNDKYGYSIFLLEKKNERRLYEILVLRRVLEMNPTILNNIGLFTPGVDILFPSKESLKNDTHVIDNAIAQIFYEVNLFNDVFDREFLEGMTSLSDIIDGYNF